MQNLEWVDKTDKKSEIEAKDVNSLANAIITIIDWINQDGGSSNIDLSNYVRKEEGKGLSSIANVRIENGADVTAANPDYFKEIYVDNQDETSDAVFVYDVNQIKSKLNEKVDKYEVDAALNEKVFIPSSKTYNVLSSNSIDLTKQIDYILDETENLYFTCDILNPVNGFANEVYVYFISGETPTTIESDENTSIKWIGDDCNSDGTFTPQANMSYEVSFKILSSFSGIGPMFSILARVGAC